eukprot:3132227-Alexandrium_andersonii.AAC.1
MSASLVGSEMCIRDRILPWLQAQDRDRAHLDVPWRTTAPSWTAGVSSASVSYTHLTLPTICSV